MQDDLHCRNAGSRGAVVKVCVQPSQRTSMPPEVHAVRTLPQTSTNAGQAAAAWVHCDRSHASHTANDPGPETLSDCIHLRDSYLEHCCCFCCCTSVAKLYELSQDCCYCCCCLSGAKHCLLLPLPPNSLQQQRQCRGIAAARTDSEG